MSERGRSPERSTRARSASPDLCRHQADDDGMPSTSTIPTAEPSHRARSASPSTSAFSLKTPGHDKSKLSREHMNRARPYFNTIHVVKFLDGFFGDDLPQDAPNLDLSHLPVPRFGDNLVAGEMRRRFARALCNAINASSLCPELRFEATSILGSELHIQAYNAEDGSPATAVALPVYIRDDKYFDPVWDQTLRNDPKYDSIRHDLLLEYLYQFQNTPRTHMFSLEITGQYARLVRSDHAGVVGSFAFDWKEEAFYLSDFLWRMGNLSNDGLGFDTTWFGATMQEAEIAVAAVRADDPEGDYGNVAVRKLLLLDDADTEDEEEKEYDVFAVLTPSNIPRPDMVGRYTMGYRAYCPVTKEVIWVKDSWTRNEAFVDPEGVTMGKLHAEGIPHLARVHSAGYVRRANGTLQVTLSGRPKFKHESVPELVYTHYRIAFRDIGRPLTTFRSSYELVTVMRDAIEAHTLAYNAGILHHDISPGNILIAKNGRGLLIDWEMALDKETLGTERYDKARQRHCGTYPYLSTARMRARIGGKRWLHDISDDLEAFFWVLFAMIFKTRYVLRLPESEGGWSPDDHHAMVYAVFQGSWGEGKLALLQGTAEPTTAEKFLEYGMEDVVSGRTGPDALVKLLGSLWQGFARAHGPLAIPSPTWRLNPANMFTGESILELFGEALGSDGWYEDDFALQCNIVKTFKLRLPTDMGERLAALSERNAEVIVVSTAVTSDKPKVDLEASQRMKRGRDDEKENEEAESECVDMCVKRRRMD